MKVDHVLILAAGKGTRMGEIGKKLPKVIWPIFEKSILELEVLMAKELAPSANIYINLFNYKEIIRNFIQDHSTISSNATIIEEDRVLDIGGAIHNLALKLNYQGNLLILNSDQFLLSPKDFVKEGLKKLAYHDAVLFSYEVNSSDGYNALALEGTKLKSITLNKDLCFNTKIKTYTGMSLIKLEALDKVTGESAFFESVANPEKKSIETFEIKEFEYWDFGTTKRYHDSIFLLVKQQGALFYKFLAKNKALDLKKITASQIVCDELIVTEDSISYKGIKNSLG